MAAGQLPDIGTEYGPCADLADEEGSDTARCAHISCTKGREDLARECPECGTLIGTRRFFLVRVNGETQQRIPYGGTATLVTDVWVHGLCELSRIERERDQRRDV